MTHEPDASRFPAPYTDMRRNPIEVELEPYLDDSSETTESYLSTDPGRVGTDFDAQMTTSGDYGFNSPHSRYAAFSRGPASRAGRSTRSYQPNFAKSPLQQATLAEEMSSDLDEDDDGSTISDIDMNGTEERTPETARYINTPPPPQGSANSAAAQPTRQTVSPFGPYRPPSVHSQTVSQTVTQTATSPQSAPSTIVPNPEQRVSLTGRPREDSVTARGSMEVVPPIDPERIRKLIEAINSALDWARTLTESNSEHVSERDAILAILYVIANRLRQGVPSRHVPLFRSLYKAIKQLTAWCQEVITHRDQYDWPIISVTLRGYIQKLKDLNNSLMLPSDPAAIALALNTRIAEHNAHRAESESTRQALKQKLREEKLARREERAQIRAMHEQLKTMKRAQKEGIEFTERLVVGNGGSRESNQIQAAPVVPQPMQIEPREATVTGRSAGPTTLEGDMRSVLTGDEDEEDYVQEEPPIAHPLSDPPSISSLGQIIPGAGSHRRGPGASDSMAPHTASTKSTPSPRAYHGKARQTPWAEQHQNRLSSVPSVPSSKPLPHRPFSQSVDDYDPAQDAEADGGEDGRTDIGTEIIEEEIIMNDGERAPSISFVPRTGGTSMHEQPSNHSYSRRYADVPPDDAPPSPRSNAGGIPAPPIHVSPNTRARSQRTTTPDSRRSQQSNYQRQSQQSQQQQQPPRYEASTATSNWRDIKDWADDTKEKEQVIFGDRDRERDYEYEHEGGPEPDDADSLRADADLLAAFNRVVNLNGSSRGERGEILDQRAEPPRDFEYGSSPDYPPRAYEPPLETIARAVGHDEGVEYPGLTRSGSPGSMNMTAQQYRQQQARTRPPRGTTGSRGSGNEGRTATADTSALPLTEHELDEPVNPYPIMNEHHWMKLAQDPRIPVDESYGISPEHGVRIRHYEDGEQPGILEVLSPQLPPLPSSHPPSRTPSRARESSHSSSRSPKIFTAIAEQAELEARERRRSTSQRASGTNGAGGGYRNAYGYADGNGNGDLGPPQSGYGNGYGNGNGAAVPNGARRSRVASPA